MIKKVLLVAVLSIGFGIHVGHAASLLGHNMMEQSLLEMESPAEDMLDVIDNKDMLKLNALYDKLSISMKHVNKSKTKDIIQNKTIGLLNSWFSLISLEMEEADDFPALSYAINQFSGQLILATKFKYTYQKDIAWMDYLGRELLLLNKYSSNSSYHQAMIQVRKNELKITWTNIKALMSIQEGGEALIQRVNPIISSILNESNTQKLIVLSEKELDLVDDIEEFFHI